MIISSGGESGGELAETCTNTSTLEAEYASYISTYDTHRLDFDIEGSYLGNTTANARRDTALAALQQANPAVQVDYTLPVNPDGLPSDALALLQDAQTKGVKVSIVNHHDDGLLRPQARPSAGRDLGRGNREPAREPVTV